MPSYTGVKVFSATRSIERAELGAVITNWIADHPELEVVEKEVLQSSDESFHCLTITLFYRRHAAASG